MPVDEGDTLHDAGVVAAKSGLGPLVEIGSYCGKSAIYLGAAARSGDTVVFSVDHHRGSEENQSGWDHHDTEVVNPETGRMDTLPFFRRTLVAAGLEGSVIPVVGDSPTVARWWTTPIGLLFIDGGHGSEPAWADYRNWTPKIADGGWLAIHDVFPNPEDGGRPPYELYCHAIDDDGFVEVTAQGSLRVLRRV
ncbi:MAG: class I SAM-dependent methyltransferase [Actinobacteria bacterium]|nr:class I SAM-dependent methyltransferase [Actinomycetota bacterium]